MRGDTRLRASGAAQDGSTRKRTEWFQSWRVSRIVGGGSFSTASWAAETTIFDRGPGGGDWSSRTPSGHPAFRSRVPASITWSATTDCLPTVSAIFAVHSRQRSAGLRGSEDGAGGAGGAVQADLSSAAARGRVALVARAILQLSKTACVPAPIS